MLIATWKFGRALSGVFAGVAGEPSWPAATCTFCSRIAFATSLAVSPRAATLSGSSQMRIE